MKLCSFISRLQELNAYLEEIPPDTEGQEISPLPVGEIMDIIYHSIPTTWKNKMIKQGFHYTDSTIKEMTDFLETRVETLETKEDRKKSSTCAKKSLKKAKKRKREDSNYSVVVSSEKSTEAKNTVFYMVNAAIIWILAIFTCYDQQAQAEKEKTTASCQRAKQAETQP